MWPLVLLVFVSSIALEFVVTKYFDSIQRRKALIAANWSVLWGAIGFVTGSSVYVMSLWLVIPELLGFWVGTYLAVKYGKPGN